MSKEFKSLNINFLDLENLIKKYCTNSYGENYSLEPLTQNEKNPIQYSIKVIVDSKVAMLNFFKNGDGTVTIQYKVGKNQDISKAIANYIRTNGIKDGRKTATIGLDNINQESIDLLLEYISNLKTREIEDTDIPHGHKYKFKSVDHSDEITITYYSSKMKLLIQGKPLYLYSEIVGFLSEYMGFEEVIKKHSEAHNVDINADEVIENMKSNLDDSYDFLGDTLHKVLSPVFVFKKIEMKLEDYSVFVFPVLRTLEGYLKKILLHKNIPIRKNFDIFEKDKVTGKYYINSEKCEIKCANTRLAVEEIYNFLYINRHPIFHASYIADSTTIIETREEADTIINGTLELIKRTYHNIILRELC